MEVISALHAENIYTLVIDWSCLILDVWTLFWSIDRSFALCECYSTTGKAVNPYEMSILTYCWQPEKAQSLPAISQYPLVVGHCMLNTCAKHLFQFHMEDSHDSKYIGTIRSIDLAHIRQYQMIRIILSNRPSEWDYSIHKDYSMWVNQGLIHCIGLWDSMRYTLIKTTSNMSHWIKSQQI